MPASFPSSVKTFTTKVDGVNDVMAVDINGLQDELVAIETQLVGGVLTYTPAPIGLTTPVIASAVGKYTVTGRVVNCWGSLDITSWAGQGGDIRVTLPVATTIFAGTVGTVVYYRQAGSVNAGTRGGVMVAATWLAFFNTDVSTTAPWEASSRVVINWGVAYMF